MTSMIDIDHQLSRQRELQIVEGRPEPASGDPFAVEATAVVDRAAERNLAITLRHLWRRRWLLVLATMAGAGIAAAVAWSIPPRYSAEARLLIGALAPHVLNGETVLPDINTDIERVQDESMMLRSRSIATYVIEHLDLASHRDFQADSPSLQLWLAQRLPDVVAWLGRRGVDVGPVRPLDGEQRDDQLIARLLAQLDVAMLGRSHVLSVKAEASDPVTAAAIANTFADKFVEDQRQDRLAALERVERFLTDRSDALREEVRRSDEAVENYRRTHGLYKSAIGPVALQQLKELNSQLMTAQAAKVQAQARLQEARTLGAGSLAAESMPELLASPLVTGLKEQLADADRRAAEARAAYGERHPALRKARAESAAVAGRLAAEEARTLESVEREARSAAAHYDTLGAAFERLKTELGAVNDQSIELDALERDAAVNRSLLESLLKRAKADVGTADMVQANAKVISPAAVPQIAAFPPKALIVGLGALCALLIAVAIAVLLEANDPTFRRAEHVEAATGLPVLAMVPQARHNQLPGRPRRSGQPAAAAHGEAIRRLPAGIELSAADRRSRVVLVSSAAPAEGKTTLVAELAWHAAANGKRVVAIDCDWRSPRLHRVFRCSNEQGLAALLGEQDVLLNDCLHADDASGVHVVPAGRWTPAMAHLLHYERLQLLLRAFAERYDLVLLDSPPVLVAADALALGRVADSAVLAVRWGHTRREAVLDALKQLIDVQADLAGIAVTRVVAREYRRYAAREARRVPAAAAVRA